MRICVFAFADGWFFVFVKMRFCYSRHFRAFSCCIFIITYSPLPSLGDMYFVNPLQPLPITQYHSRPQSFTERYRIIVIATTEGGSYPTSAEY